MRSSELHALVTAILWSQGVNYRHITDAGYVATIILAQSKQYEKELTKSLEEKP